MHSRIDLQKFLEEMLGSRNVYFQPPASVQMNYPAIVYSLSQIRNRNANNQVYSQTTHYMVTVIDKNPDSPIVQKLSQFPTAYFDRQYKADNLNHFVFNLYF